MGMLLYMMEQEAKAAAEQVAAKPVPKEEKPEVKEEVKPAEKKPTRADIMKMNVATVRKYATEQGVEGADVMSGADLKRLLVNKMFEEE